MYLRCWIPKIKYPGTKIAKTQSWGAKIVISPNCLPKDRFWLIFNFQMTRVDFSFKIILLGTNFVNLWKFRDWFWQLFIFCSFFVCFQSFVPETHKNILQGYLWCYLTILKCFLLFWLENWTKRYVQKGVYHLPL